MSSPFSTIEEFNSAIDGPTEGAIYTFANSPMINNIALLVSVGIFIWFIVKTYSPHADDSRLDKSMNHLSSFIIIGLLSLVAADYRYANRKPTVAQNSGQSLVESRNLKAGFAVRSSGSGLRNIPLGVLGMVNLGFSAVGRSRSRRKPRFHRMNRRKR